MSEQSVLLETANSEIHKNKTKMIDLEESFAEIVEKYDKELG